jgi:predicted phosphodiesterase
MPEPIDTIGLLFIGDPHLSARVPGFRKDDYPRTTLDKLRWALAYADTNRLKPVLLGDLFHYPRDNANWLLVELMSLIERPLIAIFGNHDCSENTLCADDTLAVLQAAGKLQLLGGGDAQATPWRGEINGMPIAIGGSCWGQKLPESVDRSALGLPRHVIWISHHDLRFPGYEESARWSCREIPGIDLVINGHIHRQLPDVQAGNTMWCNPGNISRVSRGDATRLHEPGVLRVDVLPDRLERTRIGVPHQPFEQVFFDAVQGDHAWADAADLPGFVKGLMTLQRLKTADGEGLRQFLDANMDRFDPAVGAAIRELAGEVLDER